MLPAKTKDVGYAILDTRIGLVHKSKPLTDPTKCIPSQMGVLNAPEQGQGLYFYQWVPDSDNDRL